MFLFDPSPPGGVGEISPNTVLGEKIIYMELKKGEIVSPNWSKVCIFFPQLTLNLQNRPLKNAKIVKPPHYYKFHLGKQFK